MSPRSARRVLACSIAALTLVVGACGSDDEKASSTASPSGTTTTATDTTATPVDAEGPAGEPSPYCQAVATLNDSDGPPTMEVFEAYAEAAPDEIADHVATVMDIVEAEDGNFMAVFSDPDGTAAIDALTAFEEETCGPADDAPDQDPSVTRIDPSATRIDVETADYRFTFDAPTTPGRYSFVSTNEGEEPHLMILLRLAEGGTLEQALESEGEEGVAEAFESEFAPVGSEMVITADLAAGDWILLCPIPDAEGTPHVAHGMIEEFTIA